MKKINFLITIALSCVLFASSCKGPFDSVEKSDPTTVNPDSNISVQRVSPSKSLLAYWPFDGNGLDFSGNGNTATLYNLTPTTDRFGNSNSAYYFNGTSSYASVADKLSLRLNNTSFTINSWVKLEAHGAMIVSKRVAGANNGWQSSVAASGPAGVLTYGPGGGSVNAWGSVVVGLNAWHMLTCTYNLTSKTLSIYIDGKLDNSTTGILTANGAITAALNIGRDVSTNTGYLKGVMDDIRIYGTVLDGSSISALYNKPAAPTNGLIAFWPLDSTGADLSGNNFHATMYNTSSAAGRAGYSNSALAFNGLSSYGSVADAVALRLNNTDFTINSWVNLQAHAAMIVSKRIAGANNGWQSSVSGSGGPSGVLTYGPGGGSVNAWGATVIGLNNWHMLTCTYSVATNTLKIYVDGILDTSTSGVLTANANISASLNIGRDVSTNTGYLKGVMEDIRIYNRSLNIGEIQQLYTAFD